MTKIFLPQETLSAIKFNSHIFVDTCVLFDFAHLKSSEREMFFQKWTAISDKGGVFVAIKPVVVEFLLGSTKQDLKIKGHYINQLIKAIIPEKTLTDETVESLIQDYGISARGNLSYVDLCLGAAVKQFNNSFLLTRNYKDFPLRIFSSRGLFAIHEDRAVRAYCLYGDNNESVEKGKKKEEIPF